MHVAHRDEVLDLVAVDFLIEVLQSKRASYLLRSLVLVYAWQLNVDLGRLVHHHHELLLRAE